MPLGALQHPHHSPPQSQWSVVEYALLFCIARCVYNAPSSAAGTYCGRRLQPSAGRIAVPAEALIAVVQLGNASASWPPRRL
jgi:hypothetical protein